MILKYGVIDFGTNSARLMIASFNGETVETLSKTINTIRLGDGMADGIITKAAMKRAKDASLGFIDIAKEEKVSELYIFATSAVREARNTDEFTSYIKKTSGLIIDVISGDDEASVGFLGATYNIAERVGLIDVGGGSTEIVLGRSDVLEYAKSFKIGTVRLLQNYPTASPTDQVEYDKCVKEIMSTFTDLPKSLQNRKWLGIGGTATAIAALHLELTVYNPKKVDNYYMSMQLLDKMVKDLKGLTAEQRKALTGLEEKRADVIVFGTIIIYEFLKLVNADGIYACESDNLEGYLIKKLGLS